MRKTKIVCTIGPACETEETITEMCKAGMNVARLNFSHGSYEEHQKRIDTIKKVRESLGLPIAILLDTKGPEYRIGTFENGKIHLNDGDSFTFTTDDIIGNEEKVSVSYKNLAKDLSEGDSILVNNGLLIFKVNKIENNDIHCTVLSGGDMSDRKSMSFPNKVLKQVFLSEQDKKDILFGIKNNVDFIACSFVSTKEDIVDVNNFLKENGGEDICVIAKIENRSGVDNIEAIMGECDGLMVARGDMGVEIPFEELPAIQKKLINTCRLLGKRSITATEMLESMISNPRPTRAEISDVANAVYDGTSAIMLSGETAAGKFPVLAVETMARIAEQTETGINYDNRYYKTDFQINSIVDAISHATCGMAIDLNAKAIAISTISGSTARMVSRFRPPMDILAITMDKNNWYKLALSWGVIPILQDTLLESTDVLFYVAKNLALNHIELNTGDRIVITGGTSGTEGSTNLIKIEIV